MTEPAPVPQGSRFRKRRKSKPRNVRTDVFKHIDMHGGDKTPCWDWKGKLRKHNKGELRPVYKCEGEEWYAHRLVWVLYNGRMLNRNEVVRHKCDRPSCCNPYHLIVGTQKDNVQDMLDRERVGHRKIDVQKIMELLEIGCKSQYISDYMKRERQLDIDASTIRRIKRRQFYKHIRWPWGDTWSAENAARIKENKDARQSNVETGSIDTISQVDSEE